MADAANPLSESGAVDTIGDYGEMRAGWKNYCLNTICDDNIKTLVGTIRSENHK